MISEWQRESETDNKHGEKEHHNKLEQGKVDGSIPEEAHNGPDVNPLDNINLDYFKDMVDPKQLVI